MNEEDFISFLTSYDDDYLIQVSEISKSFKTQQGALIENQLEMYSLDDICRDCPILKSNLPKTTDAITYKIDESGKITLYIIEFKYFNMDSKKSGYVMLKSIGNSLKDKNKKFDKCGNRIISNSLLKKYEILKRNYVDSVEVSLRLKPFETLMVALPALYESYRLNDDGCPKKDFKNFLNDIDVKLVVFVNKTVPHRNIVNERHKVHSITNALKYQYNRLKVGGVICDWQIKAAHQFEEYVVSEDLIDT